MAFNTHQWYLNGLKKVGANNTFIGGVGTILTTKELLASKIGISSVRISNFEIINNNIECYISGTYSSIGNWLNAVYNAPTYYEDIDGLVVGTLQGSLSGCLNVNYLYLPNVTSIPNDYFYYANYSGLAQGVYYLPKLESIGTTVGKDSATFGLGTGKPTKLYCSPILATSNAGGVEGDLAFGITKLVTPIYVQNFTPPNPIINLSIGNVYATAIQLNFTAPTGSANAIDFYEVYLNGSRVPYTKITASGQYIKGLTPSTVYNIEVKPVDIYYNKSTSNIVTQATAATYYIDTSSLISYYKMEGNVLDSWGVNHGTPTAITYASGLVGQTAVFNGTSSFVSIADVNNLSFTNGVNDLPFSVNYLLKFNVLTSTSQIWIFGKRTSGSLFEYQFSVYNGVCSFDIYDSVNAAYIRNNFSWTLFNTVDTFIVTNVYHGTGIGGIETYINGVLISGTQQAIGTYSKMANTTAPLLIGKREVGNFVNGQIDEVSIFNKALTAAEVSEINAKLNSGQSLI